MPLSISRSKSVQLSVKGNGLRHRGYRDNAISFHGLS